jgi:hypothetical protein
VALVCLRLSDEARSREKLSLRGKELIVGVAQLQQSEVHQPQDACSLLQMLNGGLVVVHRRKARKTDPAGDWRGALEPPHSLGPGLPGCQAARALP